MIRQIIPLLLSLILLAGCGTASKKPMYSTVYQRPTYVDMPISDIPFTYSNHKWAFNRKEAKRQFYHWTEQKGIRKYVKKARLKRLSLKKDACYIEYVFHMQNNQDKYVYICAPNFKIIP